MNSVASTVIRSRFALLRVTAIIVALLGCSVERGAAANVGPNGSQHDERTVAGPHVLEVTVVRALSHRELADAKEHTSPYVRFISLGLNLAPRVHNEFDAGYTGQTTQTIRAAAEYGLTVFGKRTRRFVEVDYQRYQYPHFANGSIASAGASCSGPQRAGASLGNPGCVTVIGGNGSTYVPAASLTENDVALHSSIYGIGHTYLATSLLTHGNNYGYPTLMPSFGIGVERLPDLSRPFSFFANAYYYPEVHGHFTAASGEGLELRYKAITYGIGLVLTVPRSPVFLQIGDVGNHYIDKQNAPGSTTHNALTLGLGAHF